MRRAERVRCREVAQAKRGQAPAQIGEVAAAKTAGAAQLFAADHERAGDTDDIGDNCARRAADRADFGARRPFEERRDPIAILRLRAGREKQKLIGVGRSRRVGRIRIDDELVTAKGGALRQGLLPERAVRTRCKDNCHARMWRDGWPNAQCSCDRAALHARTDIAPGDVVLGLASSGLHSNGYSLARKVIFDVLGLGLDDPLPMNAGTARKVLLEPTRIYVKPVLELRTSVRVKAIAHITGGGLVENVPRVLPHGTQLIVNPVSWPVPKIFTIIQAGGEILAAEMYRTFNMGIGLVVVVAATDAERATRELERLGEKVYELGHIEACQGEARCAIEGVE